MHQNLVCDGGPQILCFLNRVLKCPCFGVSVQHDPMLAQDQAHVLLVGTPEPTFQYRTLAAGLHIRHSALARRSLAGLGRKSSNAVLPNTHRPSRAESWRAWKTQSTSPQRESLRTRSVLLAYLRWPILEPSNSIASTVSSHFRGADCYDFDPLLAQTQHLEVSKRTFGKVNKRCGHCR
jgi:hypothetical protein